MNGITDGVKAVLFDLDGVIIDSEPLHVKALGLTCRHFGFTLLPDDVMRFKGFTEDRVARHFINGQAPSEFTLRDFINYKSALYTQIIKDELQLMKGAVEFMNLCRTQKWRIGLTTSALPEHAARVLQKFQLESYFDAIVTGGDVEHSKPHPEPYLKTAHKLEVQPNASIAIEDSLNGVRSAKSAGCRVIGLTSTFSRDELEAAGADLVVEAFDDIRVR